MSKTNKIAAQKIAKRLSSVLGVPICPDEIVIVPARGGWAHSTKDVQRWAGHFPRPDLPKISYSIGSWNMTLSKIAAGCAFDLHDERNTDRRVKDNDFQIEPSQKVRT